MPSNNQSVVHASLLIGILSLYGFYLAVDARALRRQHANDESTQVQGTRPQLHFTGSGGFDIYNRPVPAQDETAVHPSVIFVLRGDTADVDLRFWDRVTSALPKNSGITMLSYCDGNPCASKVKQSSDVHSFPVIAYGEVIDTESILEADEAGEFLLKPDAKHPAKRIKWRSEGSTPDDIAKSIMKE